MDSRNWRGIVISVITSAVLVVGNTGMPLLTREQFNEDGEADPAVSQELVRDVDGNWISADIEEPQDFDEEEETEDSLQEENEEEKDEVNRVHHTMNSVAIERQCRKYHVTMSVWIRMGTALQIIVRNVRTACS